MAHTQTRRKSHHGAMAMATATVTATATATAKAMATATATITLSTIHARFYKIIGTKKWI